MTLLQKISAVTLVLANVLTLTGCSTKKGNLWPLLTSPDVLIIKHHIKQDQLDIEQFCHRLYLKNPIYEPDLAARERKLKKIFQPTPITDVKNNTRSIATISKTYIDFPSHKLLEAAFAEIPPDKDRVYLLALGMNKSITEAYSGYDKQALLSGIQLDAKKLEKLYLNLQQLSWRLKTYRTNHDQLIFLTNACNTSGYINMGYEVIMTRLLTRTADDIYLRNGQTPNFIFNMSTLFLPLIL
ncbi:MAG: hypothetical protein B6I36_04045 [Desulfobacteraceae bacterium 4572_35.1]|nr:MAG: hypothetical protein B6I36_04045 [Desulfobacteraceae bacterium 4572_35.1]